MAESYQEMITAIKCNIKTSFGQLGKGAILQVIDTIIGTKANQACSSGINAPAGQATDGNMQVG